MHDIRFIREHKAEFDKGLARRGLPPEGDKLLAIDERRRAAIQKFEQAQARRNAASKDIGQAKAKKDEATTQKLMAEVNELKDKLPALDADAKAAEEKLNKALAQIPNLPLAEVPDGKDEKGNVEHHAHGRKRDYVVTHSNGRLTPGGRQAMVRLATEHHLTKTEVARRFAVSRSMVSYWVDRSRRQLMPQVEISEADTFMPKQHFELGEALGMMDFETAAKLSGARFVVLKGALARMERALGQFMLDVHTREHGYQEIDPPLLVRDDTMFGTAQLPKFRDDQFQSIDLRLPDKEQLSKAAFNSEALVQLLNAQREELLESVSQKHVYMGDFAIREEVTRQIFDNTVGAVVDLVSHLNADRLLAAYDEQTRDQRRWLIPTAEVPLTNLVRESIVDPDKLPMRLTACTPCFRAEAGAAGKDTRGMIRQHQFTKVELVSITTPEKSREEHERMLGCAEEVLKRLDLHYRVVTLCTGDMGFAAQKTYDIEVWLPGQNMYREISSCSVCGDFQARRMNARFKGKDGKNQFVHTLNGSGVAVGRALIAVMETYQQADGSIVVPDALAPYMGGMKTIERKA